ncbi:uncharacterized mitochondrial protein-like protein, partial [Tanacetum coccineum]
MKSRFQMSSMGELTFFLGLQVKQKPDGIFISQDKYVAEILKKFDFASVKTASTPIETQKPLVKDEEASDVDVHLYRSMIGSLMYVTASRPDIMFANPVYHSMTKHIAIGTTSTYAYRKLHTGVVQPTKRRVYVMFDIKGDAYHWTGVCQDEGASSERLSVEQPSPSPTPTGEIPNESLPDSSSAQPSEVPFEQQPEPSPRPSPEPSPTPIVPDSIPEPTGENLGDHSSNDASLSGNKDDMTLQILMSFIISLKQRFPKKIYSKVHKKNVSKQGRKKAKGESEVHRHPLFDEMPEDKIDQMETEDAQSEGRTGEMMDEVKELDEQRLSTEDGVSTVKEGVQNTEEQREGTEDKVITDEQKEGTEDQTKEENASKASQTSTQTPSSMTFGDDETIATLLINMSKAKAASKE